MDKSLKIPLNIPNLLSLYRLLIFPVVLYFALNDNAVVFAWLLCISLVTDILDGLIARKFNMMTDIGAKLDSIADLGTYILAFVGIFCFKAADFHPYLYSFSIFIGLFVACNLLSLIKFGRLPSLHLYSWKIGGYIQGFFFFTLFAFGFYSPFYYFMLIWGILAFIEHLLVQLALPQMVSNARGLYWVLKGRPADTAKSFPHRVGIYFKEMFPLPVYLPYVVALYFCLDLATQAITHWEIGVKEPIIIDRYGIAGMISALAMMLLMRTFDDLKDLEIDKDLFPERAIPRGDVKAGDVAVLSVCSFAILLVVNLSLAPGTLASFFIMLGYALLTFKWFFAEAIHRKNLFLTMLTHQPVPLFINYYLIRTALNATGRPHHFSVAHLALLLMFTLPVTAWETGRKTRSPDKETEYVTFSRIFGPRGSSLISLVCLLLSGFFCAYIGWLLVLPGFFFWICGVLIACLLFFYGRFILYPTARNNVLKNVTQVYTTLLFFNMLVHILISNTIHFQR